jgi:hypothetical protein
MLIIIATRLRLRGTFHRVKLRLELRETCKLQIQIVAVQPALFAEVINDGPEPTILATLACECGLQRRNGRFGHHAHPFKGAGLSGELRTIPHG